MRGRTGTNRLAGMAATARSPAQRAIGPLVLACALCLVLGGCATRPNILSRVDKTTATRAGVLEAAARQQGRPYQVGATGPKAFSDNGLVQYAYESVGTALPLAPHGLLGAGRPVAFSQARPADLVFYQTKVAGGADSLRVGLYLNNREMLYASARKGKVVIQRIDGEYWRSRLLGVVQILPTRKSGAAE